jgi:hypothetical protein
MDERINSFYSRPEILNAIKKSWKVDRSVALAGFLTERGLKAPGEMDNWRHIIIPDKFSFEGHLRIPEQRMLSAFAKTITGQTPVRDCAKRFKHGNYTILHDKDVQKPGIVALLFLDDWDESWGGYVAFMKDGETLYRFTPRRNTFLIVERKKGVRYFVKYINHRAGKRRLRIVSA